MQHEDVEAEREREEVERNREQQKTAHKCAVSRVGSSLAGSPVTEAEPLLMDMLIMVAVTGSTSC